MAIVDNNYWIRTKDRKIINFIMWTLFIIAAVHGEGINIVPTTTIFIIWGLFHIYWYQKDKRIKMRNENKLNGE